MLLPGLHTVRSERGTERGATHEQVDRATDSRARALPLRPARCDEEAEGGERRPGRTSRRQNHVLTHEPGVAATDPPQLSVPDR